MKTTEQWLAEYGESHQNGFNKMMHWVCVPAIMFSIVGLLWSIPSGILQTLAPVGFEPFFNWATLALVLALFFYVRLSLMMALGMFAIAFLMLLGNYYLSQLNIAPLWVLSLLIFAIAWVGQFYGHSVEGKKPSFLKDVQFLLIGPAWLLSFVYQKMGIRY